MAETFDPGPEQNMLVTLWEAELLGWIRGANDDRFVISIGRDGDTWNVEMCLPDALGALHTGRGSSFDAAWARKSFCLTP